jgi:hypothetical protein
MPAVLDIWLRRSGPGCTRGDGPPRSVASRRCLRKCEDDLCSRHSLHEQMNLEQQNFRIIGNQESKNELKHFCAYLYNATIRNPKAARGAQRKVEDAVRTDWSAIGNADDD